MNDLLFWGKVHYCDGMGTYDEETSIAFFLFFSFRYPLGCLGVKQGEMTKFQVVPGGYEKVT